MESIGQATENVYEQHNNSKNEPLAEVLEDPGSVDEDKLKEVVDEVLKQGTSDPATGADFHASNDESDFSEHGTGAENPANHKGNYNKESGQVSINVANTRLDDRGREWP